MATQSGWRFCKKCGGMHWPGNGTGKCPAGNGHEAHGVGFELPHSMPETAGTQANWRFCKKCAGLFWTGGGSNCPGGGPHDPDWINFVLPHGGAEGPKAQGNWRFCRKCNIMFWAGSWNRCPSGNSHDPTGSVNFVLPHDGVFPAARTTALLTPGELRWVGGTLPMLGTVALNEFADGFKTGATGQIKDDWLTALDAKIRSDLLGFQMGYAIGVLTGLWEGLKNLVVALFDLVQLAVKLTPPMVAAAVVQELFKLTDAAHRELRKKQLESAKRIGSAVKATVDDITVNPGDYVEMTRDVGVLAGRAAGGWFQVDLLDKSARIIGEKVGLFVGLVLFEIILQIVIELTTAGAGNAARMGVAAGEGARGGSRVSRFLELLKPVLERSKGLGKLLRELLAARTGTTVAGDALAAFNAVERGIIMEVRGMLRSPEILKIRQAAAAGQEVEVKIAGRWIQYQPGLPASGMTVFEENGFLIGREAFTSETEFVKTLLHETHRLTTSKVGRGAGASGAAVTAETEAAFNFAERAHQVTVSGR